MESLQMIRFIDVTLNELDFENTYCKKYMIPKFSGLYFMWKEDSKNDKKSQQAFNFHRLVRWLGRNLSPDLVPRNVNISLENSIVLLYICM